MYPTNIIPQALLQARENDIYSLPKDNAALYLNGSGDQSGIALKMYDNPIY